jgi:hypothetical protein
MSRKSIVIAGLSVLSVLLITALVLLLIDRSRLLVKISENAQNTVTPTVTTKDNSTDTSGTAQNLSNNMKHYSGTFVSFDYPSDWHLDSAVNNAVLISKGDYMYMVSTITVTGGGFGYPADGVCTFSTSQPTNLNTTFRRYDLTANYVSGSEDATHCGIRSDTKSGQIWLGSRLSLLSSDAKINSNKWIFSKDAYFKNNPNNPQYPTVEYDVEYSHKSFANEGDQSGDLVPFVTYGTAEQKAAVEIMDEISKTLVFNR